MDPTSLPEPVGLDAFAPSVWPQLMEAAAINTTSVGPRDLRRLWRLTGSTDEVAYDEFLAAVAFECAAVWPDGAPATSGELGLRLGTWELDVTKAAIRTGVLTALIATLLPDAGFAEFTGAFLTAVLPTVFDIERLELSAGDRLLLAELRLVRALTSGFATEDELYQALSPAARDEVSRYDFADFISRVKEVGELDRTGTGLIRLHQEP